MKTCKYYGKEFAETNVRKLYCSEECKRKFNEENRSKRNIFTYYCSFCGKELNNRYKSKEAHQFCDANCRNMFHEKDKNLFNCVVCGAEFKQKHKNHIYCSVECQINRDNQDIHKYKCDNCGKEFSTKYIRDNSHKFCNRTCYEEYMNKTKLIKFCEYCNKEFKTTKSSMQRFCSTECQAKWQSEYRVGKNSSTYKSEYSNTDRLSYCKTCGKEMFLLPNEIGNVKYCSDKCKRQWFANVISQSEDFKQRSRKRALQMLADGRFSHTDTHPQTLVNNVLKKHGIKFKNEYITEFFSFDNYLEDYGLFIEVMGDYWHCNPLKYDIIKYKNQKHRISRDKAKKTYVNRHYNKEILYLWETDICNDIEKCEQLINMYIDKNGKLENYHSFNYVLNDNCLIICEEIVVPYMEYDNKDLLKICNLVRPTSDKNIFTVND